jgi:excisionase family DNA binding protein
MQLTIKAAAAQVGVSKSTLLRAVRRGTLSAERDEHGGLHVDPAELHRVFPPERVSPRGTVQEGAGNGAGSAAGAAGDAVEFRIRAASLEAQVAALRELADELRSDRDQWRSEAGSWRGQAERLALAPPRRASWWWKWRAAG